MSKNLPLRSSNKPPAALIKFLKPYDPVVRELALKLRAVVIEEMAPCHENIYDAYSAVAIGYGWSDRLKDGVFHIAVYSNHVNLGFNSGVSLPDPLGILEGKGNQIRHLTFKSAEDLARPATRRYIRMALKADQDDARKLGEPLPPRKEKGGKVTSLVKAIYPKKRRPKA
ncbi:MAG TPA: DUF1801 domain-containing protein [Pyrinomonadaceae bacterium]|nr:DUF1801 domain-containing protein [Pyrinomonadaceae bacterium]